MMADQYSPNAGKMNQSRKEKKHQLGSRSTLIDQTTGTTVEFFDARVGTPKITKDRRHHLIKCSARVHPLNQYEPVVTEPRL